MCVVQRVKGCCHLPLGSGCATVPNARWGVGIPLFTRRVGTVRSWDSYVGSEISTRRVGMLRGWHPALCSPSWQLPTSRWVVGIVSIRDMRCLSHVSRGDLDNWYSCGYKKVFRYLKNFSPPFLDDRFTPPSFPSPRKNLISFFPRV